MTEFDIITLRDELQEQFQKVNGNFDKIGDHLRSFDERITSIESRLLKLEDTTNGFNRV